MNSLKNSSKKVRGIVFASVIAAIYVVLTISLSFMSFGVVQYRVAEGLTVLPFLTSYAIPGLTIGCLISNIISPVGTVDMILGTFATLIAAIATYYIGKTNLKYKKLLAPLPAVISNAIIIGLMLKYLYVPDMPLWLISLEVAWGEILCCYGLGLPLLAVFQKNPVLKKFIGK
ncbi:QueT transporter family protein [Clostridium sp. KNHs214]|uniref:QueT transporter family protein n=1 Tax=Clostridium sp. KNHs214 TaxID=1540257 RepID=UPI000555E2DC|nr:QueT transporter family protein [Clostridium sp. KNHs214]